MQARENVRKQLIFIFNCIEGLYFKVQMNFKIGATKQQKHHACILHDTLKASEKCLLTVKQST